MSLVSESSTLESFSDIINSTIVLFSVPLNENLLTKHLFIHSIYSWSVVYLRLLEGSSRERIISVFFFRARNNIKNMKNGYSMHTSWKLHEMLILLGMSNVTVRWSPSCPFLRAPSEKTREKIEEHTSRHFPPVTLPTCLKSPIWVYLSRLALWMV